MPTYHSTHYLLEQCHLFLCVCQLLAECLHLLLHLITLRCLLLQHRLKLRRHLA